VAAGRWEHDLNVMRSASFGYAKVVGGRKLVNINCFNLNRVPSENSSVAVYVTLTFKYVIICISMYHRRKVHAA